MVNKENKYITKTIALHFCLWSPWISSLFGLRDSSVRGLALALVLALVLALGSFNFFSLASIWVRIRWNFPRARGT